MNKKSRAHKMLDKVLSSKENCHGGGTFKLPANPACDGKFLLSNTSSSSPLCLSENRCNKMILVMEDCTPRDLEFDINTDYRETSRANYCETKQVIVGGSEDVMLMPRQDCLTQQEDVSMLYSGSESNCLECQTGGSERGGNDNIIKIADNYQQLLKSPSEELQNGINIISVVDFTSISDEEKQNMLLNGSLTISEVGKYSPGELITLGEDDIIIDGNDLCVPNNNIIPIQMDTADSVNNCSKGDSNSNPDNSSDINYQPLRKKLGRSKDRARTTEDKVDKQKKKHPICPPSVLKHNTKCHLKCEEVFGEDERESIHSSYWCQDYNKKRIWLNGFLKILPTKRQLKNAVKQRNNVIRYELPKSDGKNHQVCQSFFLTTLGYKCNSVVNSFLKSKQDEDGSILVSPKTDQRGKSTPSNKKDHELIKNHILKYGPRKSHYKLHHAPNRLYLPPDLTIQFMWNDFNVIYPESLIGYETYRKQIKKLNISFYESNVEACSFCAMVDANPTPEYIKSKEDHIAKSEAARIEYKRDIEKFSTDERVILCSSDMQKVVLLPRMPEFKESFFTSRLLVFNETFASMKKNAKSEHIFVIWHEAITGRKKGDVASAFITFLAHNRDAEHIILWMDNCTGQNKDFYLYSSFIAYLNSKNNTTKSITLKYLTVGHTFMAADGLHGHIEQNMRRMKNVYDLNDYIKACEKSSKRSKIIEMQSNDLIKVNAVIRNRSKSKTETIPYIKDIVEVKLEKGSQELQWKGRFDEESYKKTINFINPKSSGSATYEKTDGKWRGLCSKKNNGLIKNLIDKIPPNRREFWVNIPINEASKDLLEEGI